MSPTDATRGTTGPAAAPRRVFLSHTSDLGKPDEAGSFVAAAVAAVLRARHAVTDMAYFAARDFPPAATCVETVAQSDVYVGIIGLRYGSPLVELGPTPDAPARLAEAQGLLASMPTDALPERGPLPAGSRMPLASNPLFVGRGDELLQAARALRGGDTTVALGQVVASTGLGGLGKTQLAVELVHRYGRFFAGGVFWLSFASAEEIPLQVAACAGPGLGARRLEERVQRVRDSWQSATPRLLVFDNCEEETLLDMWRPASGACRVLVTSRRSSWSPALGVTALPLDLLPRADSIQLLRRYRSDLAPDDPGLDAIAEEVGDLPLALHLAGSYLRMYRSDVSLDGYLAELRQESVVQHTSLLGRGLEDVPNPTHHLQGVAQTFWLCLGRLDRERQVDRVAVALLARMAWMAPGEPVPRDLLSKTLENVDPLLRADGLRRLAAVGLVEEGEGWLRLHRLLVRFVRYWDVDPAARAAVEKVLIDCGRSALLRNLTGPALAVVIPHMIDAASKDQDDQSHLAALCTATGLALQCAGDLRAARSWLERALEIRERVLGPEHYDTTEGLNNLAVLLWSQGELAAARPLYERALAIRERTLGPDHRFTAVSLNNLATLLRALGEFDAARLLHERALVIMERVRGPEHPETATVLNNLALLLQNQGDLAAAGAIHERALAIREASLGPNHPDTVVSLNNLGLLRWKCGDLAAARVYHERALSLREQALGPDHPLTADSLHCLAAVLRDQGDRTSARALHERALAIRQRTLGPDHTHTGASFNDLATLFRDEGDLRTARDFFERALAIRERVLGPDHPDTVATRRALAELAAEDDGPATAPAPDP